jgi:hypothetical protein
MTKTKVLLAVLFNIALIAALVLLHWALYGCKSK